MTPNYLMSGNTECLVSTNPERSISYVLTKYVTAYMDKDVLILNQNTHTREAARLLQHHERDDIIVIDDQNNPIGIVTDEDIINKVSDISVNAEFTFLKEIMTTPLITINEKSSLQDALHKMRDHDIRKLPIVSKKNEVIGIIYQGTIANVIRDATAVAPRLLSPPVKAVLGNLGFVLQFAGVLLIVPAILSTILGETVTATGIYLTTVLLLVVGFFLNSYGEKASLNLHQASILVVSSLLVLTLFGTIPYLYIIPYEGSNLEVFASAFFSSAAGFTTGGISLFDEPENLPQSFTFYRSFTQLVGGMSFIYLIITAFYPESKLQSMRGFFSGRTLHMRELFATITIIFILYIFIVAILLYLFGERNIIDNFSLAMSTIATGGFIPNSTILDNLIWQEKLTLMGGMILGALPFTFHYALVKKKFLAPKLGKEVLVYFTILGGAMLLFIGLSGSDPLTGIFYTVSASTTAGFQLGDVSAFNGASHVILIILMFIGGCGFSTAGGIKIFRLMHLKDMRKIINKKLRSELTPQVKKELTSTIIIIALFPLIASTAAVYMTFAYEASFQDAFLEAAGLITTGGLSTGIIDFDTDPATKIIFSFLMIFGRMEIIAIIYIFVPRLI
jgi:trk system potassium uptake protein TrkH